MTNTKPKSKKPRRWDMWMIVGEDGLLITDVFSMRKEAALYCLSPGDNVISVRISEIRKRPPKRSLEK